MNKDKVSNGKQFKEAVDAYLAAGITSPIKIAELLAERGCYCAAVAVEVYIAKRGGA